MDIKDIILIGGGLLIAAVIAHGLWIAWRARRDPLRIDLVAEAPRSDEDFDDFTPLRSELPNGGARVVAPGETPRQEALELGEPQGLIAERDPVLRDPVLRDPVLRDPVARHGSQHGGPAGERDAADRTARSRRMEPRLDAPPARGSEHHADTGRAAVPAAPAQPQTIDLAVEQPVAESPAQSTAPANERGERQRDSLRATARDDLDEAIQQPVRNDLQQAGEDDDRGAPPPAGSRSRAARDAAPPRRDKVADVVLPERAAVERPAAIDEPKEPRRWTRKAADGAVSAEPRKSAADGRRAESRKSAERRPGERRSAAERGRGPERKVEAPVEELIMINLLAPKGSPFVGGGLVESLRARGLRYGDMNIFHRQDPMTRSTVYSVANVVEPGTFDMADLENFRSPGVCFFMQLPGPEQPLEVFEDMLKVARDVAVRVGGELKDEQRSVMTGQTVEHYRQRISEFCRRRMSMRA